MTLYLVDESIDVSNAKLKIMRLALESKGFKLRSKTKHVECRFGTNNRSECVVKLDQKELLPIKYFVYLAR